MDLPVDLSSTSLFNTTEKGSKGENPLDMSSTAAVDTEYEIYF